MKSHSLKVINSLQESISDKANEDDIVENEFILGGYSWIQKKFKAWRIYYNKVSNKFVHFTPSGNIIGNFENFVMAGDWSTEAKKRFKTLLQIKYGLFSSCCSLLAKQRI